MEIDLQVFFLQLNKILNLLFTVPISILDAIVIYLLNNLYRCKSFDNLNIYNCF